MQVHIHKPKPKRYSGSKQTHALVHDKKPEAADPKKHWLPVSDWAGRLILPKEGERKEGGVYFEVRQAPRNQAHLKGKRVWLNFKKADWVERVTEDVDFSKRTEKSLASGHIHPDRLDGWDDVSPMESLAGARPKDDMLVSLKDASVVNGELKITKDPVQVSGTKKALVTFEKKIDAHTWEVRHWNSKTKDFSGPKERITTTGREDLAPMKDRRLNRKGWYLYGDSDAKGKMSVSALEPRALFQVGGDQVIPGREESVDYLKNESWRLEETKKGQMTKTLLSPTSEAEEVGVPTDKVKQAFGVGDKALLLHLFGGAVGAPAMLGVYAGHFAFGLAEVVKDPFTGEAKFDVEYKQVYAHNTGGVVSGSQQWHAYMGDTKRGYLYDRPVSDALVKIPELFDDSKGTAPSEVLEERLGEMMARYRTGHGDGSSQVTAAQNCSQDSSQALYASMSDWKKAIADGTMSDDLAGVSKDIASHITPFFGWAPREWRKMAANKKAGRKSLRWLPAIKSPKTMFPRRNHETLTKMALDRDRPVMLLKTDVLGADNPEAIPAEPKRGLLPF